MKWWQRLLIKIMGEPPSPVLTRTDIARIYRRVYGANRCAEIDFEFADAIAQAAIEKRDVEFGVLAS